VNYIAGIYVYDKEDDTNFRNGYLVIFNPAKKDAKIKMIVYFEDEEPVDLKFQVPAESNRAFNMYEHREVFKNKRWGAKLLSNVPIIVQDVHGTYAPEDRPNYLTRSMCTTFAATRLSKCWYYADGIYIEKPGNILRELAPNTPLYEPEYVAFLNPNKKEAEITMTVFYHDQTQSEYKFTVPTERYKWVDLGNIIIKNKHFGARFVSTEPILVYEERIAYEYGNPIQRAVFCTIAHPWPLEWGDEFQESM